MPNYNSTVTNTTISYIQIRFVTSYNTYSSTEYENIFEPVTLGSPYTDFCLDDKILRRNGFEQSPVWDNTGARWKITAGMFSVVIVALEKR